LDIIIIIKYLIGATGNYKCNIIRLNRECQKMFQVPL